MTVPPSHLLDVYQCVEIGAGIAVHQRVIFLHDAALAKDIPGAGGVHAGQLVDATAQLHPHAAAHLHHARPYPDAHAGDDIRQLSAVIEDPNPVPVLDAALRGVGLAHEQSGGAFDLPDPGQVVVLGVRPERRMLGDHVQGILFRQIRRRADALRRLQELRHRAILARELLSALLHAGGVQFQLTGGGVKLAVLVGDLRAPLLRVSHGAVGGHRRIHIALLADQHAHIVQARTLPGEVLLIAQPAAQLLKDLHVRHALIGRLTHGHQDLVVVVPVRGMQAVLF